MVEGKQGGRVVGDERLHTWSRHRHSFMSDVLMPLASRCSLLHDQTWHSTEV